jgi:hypothetical protein
VIKGIVIGFILAIAIFSGLFFPLFFYWHGTRKFFLFRENLTKPRTGGAG